MTARMLTALRRAELGPLRVGANVHPSRGQYVHPRTADALLRRSFVSGVWTEGRARLEMVVITHVGRAALAEARA